MIKIDLIIELLLVVFKLGRRMVRLTVLLSTFLQ